MDIDYSLLSKHQQVALQSKNVSDSIRYLNSEGFKRADIATILGKRYQHVRNVLESEARKAPQSGAPVEDHLNVLTEEQRRALGAMNVSDSIRYLDGEGYGRSEIARLLGKRYQHVRNVLVGSKDEPKQKTTFTLSEATFSQFDGWTSEIGLRRDAYLGSLLPDALSKLEEAEANSEKTLDLIRDLYRPDSASANQRDGLVKVSLNVDRSLVDKMNKACAEKRIPRDLFLEGVLEVANTALGHASETLQDPIEFCETMGTKFCYNYLVSDEEAEELRSQLIDELLVAEAIARVKGISVTAARKSYDQLSQPERTKVKANPEIRKAIQTLKSSSGTTVALDDLV